MNLTKVYVMLILVILVVLAEGGKELKRKRNTKKDAKVQKKGSTIKRNSRHDPLLESRSKSIKNHQSNITKKPNSEKLKRQKRLKKKVVTFVRQSVRQKEENLRISQKASGKKLKSLASTQPKTQSKIMPALVKKAGKIRENRCNKCNLRECPSVDAMRQYCRAGIVEDACGCCVQCASSLDMPCYVVNTPEKWIAQCGTDLKCLPATGQHNFRESHAAWGRRISLEGKCSCAKSVAVCGSDKATYENVCDFREAAARQRMMTNHNISIAHSGPCRSAPKINSKPEDMSEKEGNIVSFRCETSGFPLPRVQWIKNGGNADNGRDMELPGYLNHAVTQIRGGPRKYQLTTWLTLDKAKESDSGVYVCRSTNYYGSTDAAASLRITGN